LTGTIRVQRRRRNGSSGTSIQASGHQEHAGRTDVLVRQCASCTPA
jgi:hypothetical protein